ncbi:HAMP domain-containing histidine kinase, partial [Mycobacterium tuberculosis]|nr:HAMP domain-containing histidine kinase [Mycobacterium tuberculosis]
GGTGLGLHIVYNIVTMRLGGTITLDSAPGQGTRFVIELPVTAPGEAGTERGVAHG